jgi:hypothetical protein
MSDEGTIQATDIIDMVTDSVNDQVEPQESSSDAQPLTVDDIDVKSDEGEGEEQQQPTIEVDPKNLVKLFDGDKEVTIPREAKVDVKINGKVEQMALQDVINKASGAINVDRENANLGRERKAFKQEQEKYYSEAAKIGANVQAILSTDDPLELAEYIADLHGQDPEAVYEKILTSAYDHLKGLQEMTPRERELQKQNRSFMRQQKFRQAQEASLAQRGQMESKKAETLANLEEEGFTLVDFNEALNEMTNKVQAGEPIGYGLDEIKEINESAIIDYLIVKDVNNRIVETLDGQGKKELATDGDFTNKVVAAVLKAESLSGKMSQAEMSQFIKEALRLEGKAVKENLTKRVEQSATNSQSISSKTENEEEGFGSIDELLESIQGF